MSAELRTPFNPAQERAVRCLGSELVVTAGAGSGKTRVLAGRFVAAVHPGGVVDGWTPVAPDRLLTITFTERAAVELAARVRAFLAREGLLAESRGLDDAWISTIHGLCSRLLRRHALEAGIDPEFAVADVVRAGLLRDGAFEQVAREALSSGRAVRLFDAYGVEGVSAMVFGVHGRLRSRGLDARDVVTEAALDVTELLAEAVELYAESAAGYAVCESDARTFRTNVEGCEDALGRVRALAATAADLEPWQLAEELRSIVVGYSPSLNVGAGKHIATRVRQEREDIAARACAVAVSDLAAELVSLIEGFDRAYSGLKEEAGVLDYEDLQAQTLRLLECRPRLAERYRDHFAAVMVDEFQDTDPLQARLLSLLADGDLCTVGDERQAIYGFRYADIGTFRATTRSMLERGACDVELARNYRSHRDVLSFVNEVFHAPHLFGDGFIELEADRTEPAPPRLPEGAPRVEVLVAVQESRSARGARQAEARAMAERVRAICDDSGLRAADVAVLLRALKHAEVYAEALRREGLECVIASKGRFLDLPEVRAMRALLALALNSHDDVAAGELLSGTVGRVSDDGIYRLRSAAGREPLWTAVTRAREAGLAEADAARCKVLSEARSRASARAGAAPLADVLLWATEDLGLDVDLFAEGQPGRRAFANLLKLARLAEAYEQTERGGPAGFLRRLELKERFGDREPPAPPLGEDIDAVRIMSVHAAKGLEFPLVVVADLGRSVGSQEWRFRLSSDDPPRLALAAAKASEKDECRRTPLFQELEEERATEDLAEEKRLFYVACTRAREVLVLSGADSAHSDPAASRAPLGWLRSVLGLEAPLKPGVRTLRVGAEVRVEVLPPDVEAGSVEEAGAGAAAGHEEARPAEGAVERGGARVETAPERIAYTDLAVFEACRLKYYATRILRLGAAAFPSADAPLRVGNAVHAVLRLAVAERDDAPSPARMASVARFWDLDEAGAARVEAALAAFQLSRYPERLARADAVFREMPFAAELGGGCALVGQMDVLARTGREVLVLDYKTGVGAGGDGRAPLRRLQAECYALAAFAGLESIEAVEVAFVELERLEASGAPTETTFAFTGAEAPRLREALDGRVAAISSGPFDPLPAYERAVCGDCPALGGICPVRPPSRPPR